jgi:hypothetical protein
MRLLYATTSALMVELTERFQGSNYKLWFADELNPGTNPPSSNPFHMFQHYSKVFECNDFADPKYVAHISGIKRGTRKRLGGRPEFKDARDLIRKMGVHGIRPVLAILEGDTYIAHGKTITRATPSRSGSPTSVEYALADVRGPKMADPELHLHQLY